MATLAPPFLIGSSSYLLVTRATIKSRLSSHFEHIRRRTLELAAIELLETKDPHRLIMGKCCGHSSAFIFDWIFSILTGNEDMHKSLELFDFWSDRTTDYGVSCF